MEQNLVNKDLEVNKSGGDIFAAFFNDVKRLFTINNDAKDNSYNSEGTLLPGQQMEGQLSKFTNLVKGWQYRHFVLDGDAGNLSYYLTKEQADSRSSPRGSISLSGAVTSPSEDDQNAFTVSAANGDVYKLKASGSKSRQEWISFIRAVTHYHSMSSTPQSCPSAVPASLKRSNTYGGQQTKHSNTSLDDRQLNVASPVSRHDPSPKTLRSSYIKETSSPNPISNELNTIREALNNVDEYHSAVVEALENAPQTGDTVNALDENVLMLKATAQATVNVLDQCFTILEHQASDLQQSAFVTGLPVGTTIEWLEPSQPTLESSHRTSMSDDNGSLKNSPKHDIITDTEKLSIKDRYNIAMLHDDEIEDSAVDISSKADGNIEKNKSVILHLLSQLKLGMDLTRVALPTFVLERRSLLEMYADFFAHPEYFARIPRLPSPEERMLAVLEFYLTSFYAGKKTESAKKPYNPILGEIFRCSYDFNIDKQSDIPSNQIINPQMKTVGESSSTGSSIHFIAEQVSHHPPISAFYAETADQSICMNTHIWTKSKFYGMSIGVVNVGQGVIYDKVNNEDYIITFPSAFCRSILTFPWMELGGRTVIKCPQSGYRATIVFHTKPLYGGKLHKVVADVKHGTSNESICHADGMWNGDINWTFRGDKTRMISVPQLGVTKKRVRPVEQQNDNESRMLWRNVTTALKDGNIDVATNEKHILEEKQRSDAKQRLAAGTEFNPEHFQKHESGWLFRHHLGKEQRSDSILLSQGK